MSSAESSHHRRKTDTTEPKVYEFPRADQGPSPVTPLSREESLHLMGAIVQSSEDAIASKSLDGIVTSWNPSAERMFGYSPEEIIGKPITLIIPSELRSDEDMILGKIRRGERIEHFETVRVKKSGERIHVSLTISPIKNEKGRIIGAAKIARDITERKRLEAEREARVRELESLMQLSQVLNRTFAVDELYQATVDALMRAIGADRAAVLEIDSVDDRMHFRVWNGLSEKYRAAVDGHSPWDPDDENYPVITVDDVEKDENWAAFLSLFREEGIGALAFIPIVHETRLLGKFMVYFNASHTFTENEIAMGKAFSSHIAVMIHRLKAERALRQSEKLAATGRLAATVAHEINNPLESAINLVYLARTNAEVGDAARSYLNAAEAELGRISHLSKQTLGFYRESRGAVRTRLGEQVKTLLDVLRRKAYNKGIALQLDVADDPEVIAVPGEMNQLFTNIIANSVDAVPKGGRIQVRVSSTVLSRGQVAVRVSVFDNGPGIPRANRTRIFEPFFSTKPDFGTGLGLWVCKSIVENHHGLIQVRSCTTPGNSWTAFSVLIPQANAPRAASLGAVEARA